MEGTLAGKATSLSTDALDVMMFLWPRCSCRVRGVAAYAVDAIDQDNAFH